MKSEKSTVFSRFEQAIHNQNAKIIEAIIATPEANRTATQKLQLATVKMIARVVSAVAKIDNDPFHVLNR